MESNVQIYSKSGKIAIVTGSSKGIGRAITITLAKSQNYSGIVTNGREIQEAQTVTKEIKELGTTKINAIETGYH